MMTGKPVLVTGAAGFVGSQFAWRLLEEGLPVVGVDNINAYYDPGLKRKRLEILTAYSRFKFIRLDLVDAPAVKSLFSDHEFDAVAHMAAQPGVRYSLENPHAYTESNITGFLNVLEGCRAAHVPHLVFASSSSVYGANKKVPFSVHDNVDHPVSLYAATKKANELMAHTYAHLYGIPCTGLRFFTVYGPWGRPDMAPIVFTRAILAGEPIDVFNHGRMARDFTYIDDITGAMRKIIEKPPIPDPAWNAFSPDPAASFAPYRIYNIGNNTPVQLLDFIAAIEECLGIEARKNFLPMQPGDVLETCADIEDLARDFGFRPSTPLREGIARFIEWCKSYYGPN